MQTKDSTIQAEMALQVRPEMVYQDLNGDVAKYVNAVPNSSECEKFWG